MLLLAKLMKEVLIPAAVKVEIPVRRRRIWLFKVLMTV